MRRFNYSIGILCGQCVADKLEQNQDYSSSDVAMDFEWSEDGQILFGFCPRDHDNRVEVNYTLTEEEVPG